MVKSPRKFVDIHAHILPGLTHGPANLEEAVKLVKLAEKDGVEVLAATPHVNVEEGPLNWSQVRTIFNNLQKALGEAGVGLKIFLGAEVLMSAALIGQIKKSGIPLFGKEVKYLLIEFPYGSVPFYAPELLFDIQLEGIRPIIAHPERNSAIFRKLSLLEGFVERGCLTQINCSSLIGNAGKKVRKCCQQLLTEGLVHVVASDAHNLGGRHFYFSQAFEILEEIVGEKEAINMTKKRPRCILEGVEIA